MREGQKNLQEAQDQERRKRESSHDSITKGNVFLFNFNLDFYWIIDYKYFLIMRVSLAIFKT